MKRDFKMRLKVLSVIFNGFSVSKNCLRLDSVHLMKVRIWEMIVW